MTYRDEAPAPPLHWHLLVRTTVHHEDGRAEHFTSWRGTRVLATTSKAEIAIRMSALNGVRRDIAKRCSVAMSRVDLVWFDLVVGDEDFAE